MSCPLQGTDNWGHPGDPGTKGEIGETGIPSTAAGVPGSLGHKGTIGDPGRLKFISSIIFCH